MSNNDVSFNYIDQFDAAVKLIAQLYQTTEKGVFNKTDNGRIA